MRKENSCSKDNPSIFSHWLVFHFTLQGPHRLMSSVKYAEKKQYFVQSVPYND